MDLALEPGAGRRPDIEYAVVQAAEARYIIAESRWEELGTALGEALAGATKVATVRGLTWLVFAIAPCSTFSLSSPAPS